MAYSTEVVDTYASLSGSDEITITRTGTNEITLSNEAGTFLSSDLAVTITGANEISISGTTTTYSVSDSNVTLVKSVVGTGAISIETLTLTVKNGSNTFTGTLF